MAEIPYAQIQLTMERLYYMKKISFFAALVLLFACTPENNPDNGGNNNNGGGNTQPTVVELTGISLTDHEIRLEKGENKTLEVKFTPENATDKSLTWESSNTSIAKVSNGVVVGVAPGTTEVSAKSGNFTDKCTVTVVSPATSVSLDQTELTLAPGETATINATVLPEDSTDEVEWSSSDETIVTAKDGTVTAVAEGDATITAKAGEKTATCSVTVKAAVPKGAVDLGIEMTREDGTKYKLYWAECNIGAGKPEDYGNYYAWGELETKEVFTWENYRFRISGTYWGNVILSKYNTQAISGSVDNNTVLDPEDDVAHVKLGGKWRIPTLAELSELSNKCTGEWTQLNGVNGYKVIGPNENSIFLPAAGNSYELGTINQGLCSYYWSSDISTAYPTSAYNMGVDSSGKPFFGGSQRYEGRSIRPVTE